MGLDSGLVFLSFLEVARVEACGDISLIYLIDWYRIDTTCTIHAEIWGRKMERVGSRPAVACQEQELRSSFGTDGCRMTKQCMFIPKSFFGHIGSLPRCETMLRIECIGRSERFAWTKQ
jgi:hypothetical protein